MLGILVAATVAPALPTPYDYVVVRAELHADPAAPPLVAEPLFRSRVAVVELMLAGGHIDPGLGESWFGPRDYASEIAHARRMTRTLAGCPPAGEGAWVPEPEYWSALALGYQRRACEYRGRVEWEPDRAEALQHHAARMEQVASAYATLSCRGWARPRRVYLRDVKDLVGPDIWDARRLPE